MHLFKYIILLCVICSAAHAQGAPISGGSGCTGDCSFNSVTATQVDAGVVNSPKFVGTGAGNTAVYTVTNDLAEYCLNAACTATPIGSNADYIKDDGSGDMVLQAKSGASTQIWRNLALESGLTSPAGTNASAGVDFSGFSGAFKTSTGAATFGGSSNTFTNSITSSTGNITASVGAVNGAGFQCNSGSSCLIAPTTGSVPMALDCAGGTCAVNLGITNATSIVVGSATTTKPVQIAGASGGAFKGTCAMSASTSCTATVPSGALCMCFPQGTEAVGTNNPFGSVSSTTFTCNSGGTANSLTWTILCL